MRPGPRRWKRRPGPGPPALFGWTSRLLFLATVVVLSLPAPGSGSRVGAPEPPHLAPFGLRTDPAAGAAPVGSFAAVPFVPERVLSTIALVNGTRAPGNVLFPNGSNPGALLYDGTNRTVYVAETGSHRLGEVNATSNRLENSVLLGGSPSESPAGLALYTAGQRVFVAESGGTNVTVLSTATNRVIGTIAVGSEPRAAAVVSAAAKMYVANFGSDNLTVINPFTSAELGSTPTGHHPVAALFDVPGQVVIVANRGSNTVTVIDPFNSSNDTTLSVGSQPDALAVDPFTQELLVANYGDNDLSVFNATTLAPLGVRAVGQGPVAVAASWTGFSYTGNGVGGNVTVYNDSSRRSVSDLALPGAPSAVLNDPLNGKVYVSLPAIDSLVIVSDATHLINGTVPVGARPSSVAYDSHDDRYFVAVPDLRSLAVIDASTGALLGRVPLPAPPSHLLYLPAPSRVYVTLDPLSGLNGSVIVLDPVLWTILATIPVGVGPQGLAVEAVGPDLFVADAGGGQLSVIDLNLDTVVANVSLPKGPGNQPAVPQEIAVDGRRNLLYVSEGNSSPTVEIVNATNRSAFASVGPFSMAVGSCYVPGTDELWIADAGAGVLRVVNGSSRSVIANVTVGAVPTALAYVAATGLVYALEAGPNSVALIGAANRTVQQSIGVGATPVSLAVDLSNANVSVANAGQGTLSFLGVLNDTTAFSVNFTETGMPLIGLWTVTYDGVPYDSYASWLVVASRNGTYAYTVQTALPLHPVPAYGNLTVDGRNLSVSIAFLPQLYQVKFQEKGLPNGTSWWVSLDATDPSVPTTNSTSTGSNLTVPSPNGSYQYNAGTAAAFVAPISSGSVLVNGNDTLTVVQFVPLPPYSVEFHRTGISNGTAWSVNLSGVEHRSNQSTVTFREFNGSFGYDVGPVGGLRPTPAAGIVRVDGASPTPIEIQFAPMQFAVTFTESGLPAGTVWTVTLGGVERSTPNGSVAFAEFNGSFDFVVGKLIVFLPSPENGTARVAGRPLQFTINFSNINGVSGDHSVIGPELLALLGVFVAVAVLAAALQRRRRRRFLESEELPIVSESSDTLGVGVDEPGPYSDSEDAETLGPDG